MAFQNYFIKSPQWHSKDYRKGNLSQKAFLMLIIFHFYVSLIKLGHVSLSYDASRCFNVQSYYRYQISVVSFFWSPRLSTLKFHF